MDFDFFGWGEPWINTIKKCIWLSNEIIGGVGSGFRGGGGGGGESSFPNLKSGYILVIIGYLIFNYLVNEINTFVDVQFQNIREFLNLTFRFMQIHKLCFCVAYV